MGITHNFDIEIENLSICLRDLEVFKGDYYGCTIFVYANIPREMIFRVVLRPDWSEVETPKPVNMTLNDKILELEEVENTLHRIVYKIKVMVTGRVVIRFFSDYKFELFKNYFPIINLNLKKGEYKVVEQNYTYANIDSSRCS